MQFRTALFLDLLLVLFPFRLLGIIFSRSSFAFAFISQKSCKPSLRASTLLLKGVSFFGLSLISTALCRPTSLQATLTCPEWSV